MNKKSLNEIAQDNKAIKTSRNEPIQHEPLRRQSMDFIRSLALDIPVQTTRENPMTESFNLEQMIETVLEKNATALEEPTDENDYVSFDIPLLIRILEHAREGVPSDVDLHNLVERIISIRSKGVLTMDDYEIIAGGDIEGTDKENAPSAMAIDQQDESIDMIRKLAGL